MTKKQIRKIAQDYLKRNRLMTLATSDRSKPWASTVFFAFDDKFNIYFYSRENTKHCQIIKSNPNVAIAINQDWGSRGLIKGFILTGLAAKVSKDHYATQYALYRKRFIWADKFKDHVLYRIQPAEVWLIDQKVFKHFFRVRIK